MKILLHTLLFFIFSVSVQAKTEVDNKTKEQVLSEISKILKVPPSLVEESLIPGLYTVLYGTQLFFVSKDGRYAFEKPQMIDLKTRADVSDKLVSVVRKEIVDKVELKNMVVYKPKQPKHVISVFTDIDCTYCEKLHNERQQLLDGGVEIRYMMYPRAGVDSDSYKTAEAVFCSSNQQKAMTDAKAIAAANIKARRNGEEQKAQVKSPKCESPIKEHMALLHELGMEVATPQILLTSGELLRGYVPAKDLLHILTNKK